MDDSLAQIIEQHRGPAPEFFSDTELDVDVVNGKYHRKGCEHASFKFFNPSSLSEVLGKPQRVHFECVKDAQVLYGGPEVLTFSMYLHTVNKVRNLDSLEIPTTGNYWACKAALKELLLAKTLNVISSEPFSWLGMIYRTDKLTKRWDVNAVNGEIEIILERIKNEFYQDLLDDLATQPKGEDFRAEETLSYLAKAPTVKSIHSLRTRFLGKVSQKPAFEEVKKMIEDVMSERTDLALLELVYRRSPHFEVAGSNIFLVPLEAAGHRLYVSKGFQLDEKLSEEKFYELGKIANLHMQGEFPDYTNLLPNAYKSFKALN